MDKPRHYIDMKDQGTRIVTNSNIANVNRRFLWNYTENITGCSSLPRPCPHLTIFLRRIRFLRRCLDKLKKIPSWHFGSLSLFQERLLELIDGPHAHHYSSEKVSVTFCRAKDKIKGKPRKVKVC